MITCSRCSKPAVIFIRYNGTHLCNEHFIIYFEKRVKKEMRKQGTTDPNSIIGVAVSGGKDSLVALKVINDMFMNRSNIKVLALSVDEGIKNYRNESLNAAKKYCKKIDVEHYIVTFKDEIEYSMDEISKKKTILGACSYCGVFRRICLNTLAKKLKLTKLATGHNLDDVSQSILMNFVNADIEKLARLGPHTKVQPGLIPRIMPLKVIPENENALYAILNEIEFHDGICPYSTEALRGVFKEIIYDLENKNPGTRHSILRSYELIKEQIQMKFPPSKLKSCERCGEPTAHMLCKACEMIKNL
jgi:uncharacterized protein (TIGR00269 family)